MTLVDTSVWVEHLRKGNSDLTSLLQVNEVLMHPFIIGEIACGTLNNRTEVLSLYQELPFAQLAEHSEVLHFVETHKLWGRGVGWIDVHLLASALLSHARLWTFDRRLKGIALEMDVEK